MNQILQREFFIALNAQPLWLRVIKYIVLLTILTFLYKKYKWEGVLYLVIFVLVVGSSLHFFLRWKTDGWTKSWGPVTLPIVNTK